eukprot:1154313-Pelagomonas_calceolata.AAC.5
MSAGNPFQQPSPQPPRMHRLHLSQMIDAAQSFTQVQPLPQSTWMHRLHLSQMINAAQSSMRIQLLALHRPLRLLRPLKLVRHIHTSDYVITLILTRHKAYSQTSGETDETTSRPVSGQDKVVCWP